MGVLISLALGLVFWLVLWALGAKAVDPFLITILLVLIAVTVRAVKPFVEKLLGGS
jgi:hypothetical protein